MEGYDAYTADDSGEEIARAKNDPALVDKVSSKVKDVEREQRANLKSSEEFKSLQNEKEVLNNRLSELRKEKGKEARSEVRDIRRKIKDVERKIKDLESGGWNDFRKGGGKSIGI